MSYGQEIAAFGENVYPGLLAELAPDTLNILKTGAASDGGGGQITGAETNVNATPIPCIYQPVKRNSNEPIAEKMTSITEYKIIFPANHAGAALSLKTHYRLRVLSRGNQTAKTFSLNSWEQHQGVFIKAICKLED